MSPLAGLPSYVFNVVTRKLTFCILLGFLAAKVGRKCFLFSTFSSKDFSYVFFNCSVLNAYSVVEI